MNGQVNEMTENKTSIEEVYDLVERAEQQRKRLYLIVAGISISSLLGVSVDAFGFMAILHQKGPLDILSADIILLVSIFVISIILAALAARKLIALKRLNQKLGLVGELEETIYNEVLKARMS